MSCVSRFHSEINLCFLALLHNTSRLLLLKAGSGDIIIHLTRSAVRRVSRRLHGRKNLSSLAAFHGASKTFVINIASEETFPSPDLR